MARHVLPADPSLLDPCAPYDVRPEDLRGLPFGVSVRVSDKTQDDNGSKDLQLRRGRAWARTYGLVDSGSTWTRTQTGKKVRSALETKQQLEAARAGKIRVLIFYDSSRYARDLLGALQIEEELHRAGCFIVYLEDGETIIASNASTRAAKNRKHAENQEYVDKLTRRITDGIEGHVLRGDDDITELVSQAGVAPFGWCRPSKYDLPLAHHPRESRIVLRIVDRFLDPSETCATVAAWANEEGYRTKRGNEWTKQSIYDLLTLPLHRGVIGFHTSRKARGKGYIDGLSGSIAPLIEPALAARIDAKLAQGLRGRSCAVLASHDRRFIYVLGGLAVWTCGRKATAQYGGSTAHPRYHHHGSHPYCDPERQSYAQEAYIRHLGDFWAHFTLAEDVCDRVLARLADKTRVGPDSRALEISRLESELRAKAAEFVQPNSTITALELERLKRSTADRIAELRAQPAPEERRRVNLAAAADMLRRMGAVWGEPTDDAPAIQAARRDLIVALFDRVELWGPYVVRLHPKPEFAALLEAGAYQIGTRRMPQIAIVVADSLSPSPRSESGGPPPRRRSAFRTTASPLTATSSGSA